MRKAPVRLLGVLLAMAVIGPARGDYPLLQQLDQQTRSLYQEVQSGLVRVELPVPRWVREAAEKDDPLKKWDGQIDPQVRQKLEAYRSNVLKGAPSHINATLSPNARPSTRPATLPALPGWRSKTNAEGDVVLESSGSGASIVLHAGGPNTGAPPSAAGPVRPHDIEAGAFAPNNIGLLLDEEGHVLVPLYIEKETIGDGPVRMMVADAEVTAHFVGSDQKTNLTILKMDHVVGRPIKMAGARPADGSLVMMLNPANGAGRLSIWTGGERDYGAVVNMDGSVCGIVRFGQFLGGPACSVVIDQLKKVGHIERAILGARLSELGAESPIRQRNFALGGRPALLVEEVSPASLAEKTGLKKGDLILQLGAEPVGDLTTWAALSAQGGESRLMVLRGQSRVELDINLQAEK